MTSSVQKEDEPNKGGRPKGTGRRISKLRRIANRLEQMARTQAMNIIQQSLDGAPVDKEKLQTAKWTVNTAASLHKACLQEEEALSDGDTPKLEDEEEGTGAAVFSMKIVK